MATATLTDAYIGRDWTNLVATYAGLANADACIQNKATSNLHVVFGGASAPKSDDAGLVLGTYETVSGNAAAIWVRSVNGGKAGVTTL